MGQLDRLPDRQRNSVERKSRQRKVTPLKSLHESRSAPGSCTEARSPSGKAKVCKTFIGGSVSPRAPTNFLEFFPPPPTQCKRPRLAPPGRVPPLTPPHPDRRPIGTH